MTRIRVLIADDHPLVVEGLQSMLGTDPNVEVVGVASGGREAVTRAQQLAPDVALLDIRMEDMDGISAAREIKRLRPTTSVVMLTMYENPDYLFEAVKAGASGYLLKDVTRAKLLEAIYTVADGGSLLNQEVVGRFLRRLAADVETGGSKDALPASDRLTARELEVLRLVASGLTNKEIGARLSVTVATVKTHVENIIQKLQVSDRTQAAVQALARGLLQ